MTDKPSIKGKQPHRRKPGDKYPARTGNQVIVRICLDEILALRKSQKLSAICNVIAEMFVRDRALLTPQRLSSNLIQVLKADSKTEAEQREERVNKLNENMSVIMQNLMIKSALHNENMASINKPSAVQTTVRSVGPVKAKLAPVAVQKSEVKQEAIGTSVGTVRPVISQEMKKWIDYFFQINESGTPTGRERDYVVKYISDHWDELNAREVENKGAMIKEVKEVFNGFRKQV